MKAPSVKHTPAGGSPRRPVPKVGDIVEVVKLPDQPGERLRMGARGEVQEVRGAMFYVRFSWGVHALNSLQIEPLRT